MNRRPSKGRAAARALPTIRALALQVLAAAAPLRAVGAVLAAFAAATLNAATKAPERIPPLRPPSGEIPPGFWEEHGALAVAGILLALVLAGLAGWFLTRRKPQALPPAEALARRALEPLRRRPEDGATLSRVSQVLRHYLAAAFGLPPVEMTCTEFCRVLSGNERVGTELAGGIAQFLRGCDERKFAPAAPQPPVAAVEQALNLINAAERRLAATASAQPGTCNANVR